MIEWLKGSASIVVNELWQLTEAECEELRILQTIAPLVGADQLVMDWSLARVRGHLPLFKIGRRMQ